MKPSIICLIAMLSISAPIFAKPKPPAQCAVYFTVAEHDEITVGLTLNGLNKPQTNWYKNHGDRDKSAGICYVAKASDAPDNAPVYLVIWGEHIEGRPYTYTYTTTQTVTSNSNGTVTDNEGNTANISGTSTTEVPVQHTQSGVSRFYVADGWLTIWDSTAKGPDGKTKGNFVPVGALHNHNRTKFTSASTSLLKDAMEQIRDREKDRLPK